jgi:hypothetical protein
MALNIEKVRNKIERYFRFATKEKLHQDMMDAGYEIYSKVSYQIPEMIDLKEETRRATWEVSGNDSTYQIRFEGKDIVRPSYPSKAEDMESANREIIKRVSRTRRVSTASSSFTWSSL